MDKEAVNRNSFDFKLLATALPTLSSLSQTEQEPKKPAAEESKKEVTLISIAEISPVLRKLSSLNKGKGLPKYSGWTLAQQEDGSYIITDQATNKRMAPDAGVLYIFVVMPDKTTRIAVRYGDGHACLADRLDVRYAGEVVFKKAADKQDAIFLKEWSNFSLTYQPAPNLKHQAGFDPDLFIDRLPKKAINTDFFKNVARTPSPRLPKEHSHYGIENVVRTASPRVGCVRG